MYGGERTVTVERPRRGLIAWIRRRVGWLADPEPVRETRTEPVEGLTTEDVENIAIYNLSHRGL